MATAVLLCVLSTFGFCICARALISLSTAPRVVSHAALGGFSGGARRFARNYMIFALSLLAIVALLGAAFSFIELFSL